MKTFRLVADIMVEATDREDAKRQLAAFFRGWAGDAGDMNILMGLSAITLLPAEDDYSGPDWVATRTRSRENRT